MWTCSWREIAIEGLDTDHQVPGRVIAHLCRNWNSVYVDPTPRAYWPPAPDVVLMRLPGSASPAAT
jgi:hypothetical protein